MFGKSLPSFAVMAVCLLQLVSAGTMPAEKRSLRAPGIVYSPYKGTEGNSACKTPQEVGADIERLKGYGLIRLYGLDCQQVDMVLPHAKKHGIPLFIGIYEVDELESEVKQLAKTMNGDWSLVHTVSIGNEFVLAKKKTAAEMVALTAQGRRLLRGAEFKGNVVSVNVFHELLQDQTLCQEQDIIAMNLHPFFDGNVRAENAGPFALEMVRQVKEKCPGKEVLVTEIGWPHTGETNKEAVPSRDNQKKALASIKQSLGNNYILFTAFDDHWKPNNERTFNAEKFWGVL